MLRTDYSRFYPVTGAALNRTNEAVNAGGSGGEAPVSSVNGEVGAVVLSAGDVGAATTSQGAKADTAVQPAALSGYVPTTRTVAGKPLSANVSLVKGDVGLGNVDNTADTAKPVSSATQTALDGKANSSHTHTIANVSGLQTALDEKVSSVNGDSGVVVINTTDIGTATGTPVHLSGFLLSPDASTALGTLGGMTGSQIEGMLSAFLLSKESAQEGTDTEFSTISAKVLADEIDRRVAEEVAPLLSRIEALEAANPTP